MQTRRLAFFGVVKMTKSILAKATGESVRSFRESVRDGGLHQIAEAAKGGVIIPSDAFSRELAPYAGGLVASGLHSVKIAQPKGEWVWTTKTATAGYDARIPVFVSGAKETHQGQLARGYSLGRGLLTKYGVEEAFSSTPLAGALSADLQGYTRAGDMGATKALRYHHTASSKQGIDVAFSGAEAQNMHSAKWEAGIVGLVLFLAATHAHGYRFSDEAKTRAKVDMAVWGDVDNTLRAKWYNECRAPAKVVAAFEEASPGDPSLEAFVAWLRG